MTEETIKQLELKEAVKEQQAIKDIRSIITTQTGRSFLKYLLVTLDFGKMPEPGLPDNLLHDYMGFLRAGNSVFKLIAAADPSLAGQIIAQIEKERNEIE